MSSTFPVDPLLEEFLYLLIHETIDDACRNSEEDLPSTQEKPLAGSESEDSDEAPRKRLSVPIKENDSDGAPMKQPESTTYKRRLTFDDGSEVAPTKRPYESATHKRRLTFEEDVAPTKRLTFDDGSDVAPSKRLSVPSHLPRRLGVNFGASDQIRLLRGQISFLTRDRDFYRAKVSELQGRLSEAREELESRERDCEEMGAALRGAREARMAEEYEESEKVKFGPAGDNNENTMRREM